jgi:hypothetical protein
VAHPQPSIAHGSPRSGGVFTSPIFYGNFYLFSGHPSAGFLASKKPETRRHDFS